MAKIRLEQEPYTTTTTTSGLVDTDHTRALVETRRDATIQIQSISQAVRDKSREGRDRRANFVA